MNRWLALYGHAVLTHTRRGRYRWWYELDSYRLGAMRHTPETDWSVSYKGAKQLIFEKEESKKKYKVPEGGMDHTPDHDAHKIVVKFLQISDYIERNDHED